MPILVKCLWQGWSRGLVHCTGENAIDPIWRVLASSNGISSWTPLKPQHSIPCRLFVQCCQKKDHQNFVGGFVLSGRLGSGRTTMLPLGTLSLGLWVIAVDPSVIIFFTGHQSFKTCRIWIDLLDHLPAVMKTSFFLIFSEDPWYKIRANLPHLQFLTNNCVYSSLTDTNCALIVSKTHDVLIHENLNSANQLWCIDFLIPPTHPPTSLTDSLPSLNLYATQKHDARFMQDASKSVLTHSIRSVAFFPSLKHNFIAYRSSKVSLTTRLHLWNSPAVTIRL